MDSKDNELAKTANNNVLSGYVQDDIDVHGLLEEK